MGCDGNRSADVPETIGVMGVHQDIIGIVFSFHHGLKMQDLRLWAQGHFSQTQHNHFRAIAYSKEITETQVTENNNVLW